MQCMDTVVSMGNALYLVKGGQAFYTSPEVACSQ